jgi:hypothetical protein
VTLARTGSSARREGDRPPAPLRSGFNDPDFAELCALVQNVRALRTGRWSAGRQTLRMLPHTRRLIRSVNRLPHVTLDVSKNGPGKHIRASLKRRLFDARHLVAISTLSLPRDFEEYRRGRSRQALRTNCTRAVQAGIGVVKVDDPDQIRQRMADLFETRNDPDGGAWYFERAALGEGEFWFATAADDRALALAEVIVDESVALLRSLISANRAGRSEARYLLMAEILNSLCHRGVRHVVIGRALSVPPGLIHFQKLLGFAPKNLRIVHA